MNSQVLAVVLVVISTCSANTGIPALLLSSKSGQFDEIEVPSAGQITPTEKFSSVLKDVSASDLTIIFEQDEMASEDFLRRDSQKKMQTVYPQLSKLTREMESLYFPAVKAPAHAIKTLEAKAKHSNVVRVGADENLVNWLSTAELSPRTLVIITLPATTDEEILGEQLTKIDGIISSVISTLDEKKLGYTVIYTGLAYRKAREDAVKAGSRHLLAAGDDPTSTRIVATASCFCLVLDNLKANGKVLPNDTNVDVTPSKAPCGNTVNVTLDGSSEVKMYFVLNGMYWGLASLTVGGEAVVPKNRLEPIGGIRNQSYHCLANTTYAADSKVLSYTRIQVEPFCDGTSFSAAYPNDCIGIFTGTLLSALFISLLLLSITCIGTGLLANVASNDRFDDPKGIPLAVTVSE